MEARIRVTSFIYTPQSARGWSDTCALSSIVATLPAGRFGLLLGDTSDAIEDAYRRWRSDPTSVDETWRTFFEGFELGLKQPAEQPAQATRQQIGVVRLIDAYRRLGHVLAQLDPLSDPPQSHPLLELSWFGLQESDL